MTFVTAKGRELPSLTACLRMWWALEVEGKGGGLKRGQNYRHRQSLALRWRRRTPRNHSVHRGRLHFTLRALLSVSRSGRHSFTHDPLSLSSLFLFAIFIVSFFQDASTALGFPAKPLMTSGRVPARPPLLFITFNAAFFSVSFCLSFISFVFLRPTLSRSLFPRMLVRKRLCTWRYNSYPWAVFCSYSP